MIHFKDAKEILNILRDVQAYMFVQSRNDTLGELILTRIDRVLKDNDNKNVGEKNETTSTEQPGQKSSNK